MAAELNATGGSFAGQRQFAVRPQAAMQPQLRPAPPQEMPQDLSLPRESSLSWEGNENDGEYQVIAESHAMVTSVALPEAVRGNDPTLNVSQNLTRRFLSLYEQVYGNTFHHNRLVSRVAEWLVGNCMDQLARLGVDPSRLAEVRERVRQSLIEGTYRDYCQVVYDETVMEICT